MIRKHSIDKTKIKYLSEQSREVYEKEEALIKFLFYLATFGVFFSLLLPILFSEQFVLHFH